MNTTAYNYTVFKIMAALLLTVVLLFAAPVVARADGGGGGGDGGGGSIGASISTAIGGFADGVASVASAAVGVAVDAANAAIGFASAAANTIGAAVDSITSAVFGSSASSGGTSVSVIGFMAETAIGLPTPQGAFAFSYNGVSYFSDPTIGLNYGINVGDPTGGTGGGGDSCPVGWTSGNGGCVPPACNIVNETCTSSANACGSVASGTRNVCYDENNNVVFADVCSAAPPTLPSYVGTACTNTFTNICGYADTAYGAYDCSNTCAITYWPPVPRSGLCTAGPTDTTGTCPLGFTGTPPSCTRNVCPTGTTGTYPDCTVPLPLPPGDPRVSIDITPTIVTPGDTTMVTWSTKDVSGCTINADTNADTWTARNGRKETSTINTRAVYTVSCDALSGETVTDSATVYIVPNWQEI